MERYEFYEFPKKYWKSHNFCWYIHDIILSIFNECLDDEDETKMSVKIKDNGRKKLSEINDSDDIIDWLRDNGYSKEANLLLKQKIFHALLGDFLGYVHESLETSMKGKTAISYTLLRKPFKDNLFYMEWLLFNGDELLKLVDENRIEEYEVGTIRKKNRSKMKEIISNAFFVNEYRSEFEDAKINWNFFYDVRFDYNKKNSLELMWNSANHLVTTARQIKTIDFNSIFLLEEDYTNRWEYYYSKLPILLLYSLGIVIKLYIELIEDIPSDTRIYNNLFIITQWLNKIDENAGKSYIEHIISEIGDIPFVCKNCEKEISISKNTVSTLLNEPAIYCASCGEHNPIARYQFVEINTD